MGRFAGRGFEAFLVLVLIDDDEEFLVAQDILVVFVEVVLFLVGCVQRFVVLVQGGFECGACSGKIVAANCGDAHAVEVPGVS